MSQGKELDPGEMAAWRSFFRMQELLRSRLEQQLLADSGLSNADYTVLVVLSEAPDGNLRLVELGKNLAWEKSRLAHQLTRMCGRGLVERSSGTGRAVHASITPAGRQALEAAVPRHRDQVRTLVLDRLSHEQLDYLRTISDTILNGLDEAAQSQVDG